MPDSSRWVYPAVIHSARALMRLWGLRIEVRGGEHVPPDGPVVLAANHVSFLDFVLLGRAARQSGRHVRFLARHDLWRPRPVGAALTAMGHVPVDRAAPAAAYLGALRHLESGEALGIFPEAGISRSLTVRGLMPGAVALARASGAPLLPVAMWGQQRALSIGRAPHLRRGIPITLEVGSPLDLGGDPERVTERLGSRLQQMVDGLALEPRHRAPGAWWTPAHLGGAAPSPADVAAYDVLPRGAVAPTGWAPSLDSSACPHHRAVNGSGPMPGSSTAIGSSSRTSPPMCTRTPGCCPAAA